ncbi:WhiB family transcriptional regulator [Streptomyces sp. NPDC007988]|uniref:WhiB family transcriptional regulator n=1 Tax=Streptomyces sp. NPDC007988 TaxID=3364802 RepID=UPI0036E6817E
MARRYLRGSANPHRAPLRLALEEHVPAANPLSEAACAGTDTEVFFDGTPTATETAKRTCMGCPVRTACLELALERGERFGIFGGLTADERRALRRKGVRAA